jgi:hypothetical protein
MDPTISSWLAVVDNSYFSYVLCIDSILSSHKISAILVTIVYWVLLSSASTFASPYLGMYYENNNYAVLPSFFVS